MYIYLHAMWLDIQLFNGRAIVEIFVTIKNSIQNC